MEVCPCNRRWMICRYCGGWSFNMVPSFPGDGHVHCLGLRSDHFLQILVVQFVQGDLALDIMPFRRQPATDFRFDLVGHHTVTMYSQNKRDKGTDLREELYTAVQMPGWANIWTQPIINRIDMLATGVRTHDRREGLRQRPDKIQEVSEQVAEVLQADPRRGGRGPRPDPGQGLPGNQDRPRAGGPLRRQRRRRPGRDRDGPGRQGDHHHGRGPRAVPGAGPLRPRLARGRGGREKPAGQRGGADGIKRRQRPAAWAGRPRPRQTCRREDRCKSPCRWSPT